MPCKHCHKSPPGVRAPRVKKKRSRGGLHFKGIPFCRKCWTQHKNICPTFPRDVFKPGTTRANCPPDLMLAWLMANKVTR